jgi:hypothetical protein
MPLSTSRAPVQKSMLLPTEVRLKSTRIWVECGSLDADSCSCPDVQKILLQAFVSARKLEIACTRMIFANSGTVKKVDPGETVFGIHIRAGNNEEGDFSKKGRGCRYGRPEQFVSALVKSIRSSLSIESLPRPPMFFPLQQTTQSIGQQTTQSVGQY